MRAEDVHSCSFILVRSGTLPLRNPRIRVTRATCKLPANTLLIRSVLKLEGIYVQEIPGSSLAVYSSLVYSLCNILVNRTQNSPLIMPFLGKMCKAFEAWRAQYNQSLLRMKYLQLNTGIYSIVYAWWT